MFGMPKKGEIDYSVDIDLDLANVQPSVAGPKRPQDRINLPELGRNVSRTPCRNRCTTAATERSRSIFATKHAVELNGSAPRNGAMFSTDTKEDQGISPGEARNMLEMVSNRPTPDQGKEIEAESSQVFRHGRSSHWPRQRPDRRDHELHEHEQPERDACGWIAGEKSSRARSACRSRREDVARTRVARCYRLLAKRPDCKHISTSSDSISSVTVARLASETRGRCIQTSRRRSTNTIWLLRRFFREIEISKRACISISKRIF